MRPIATTRSSSRLLFIAVAGGSACVNTAVVLWMLVTQPVLNSDFRGPWSFARFAGLHAAQIYQAPPLQAFQQLLYPGFRSFFPCQYPPSFLLATAWLRDWDFATAKAIWTVAGLGGICFAAWMFFAREQRWLALLALLASPACLLNIAAGETGFFTTALLLLGFAALPAKPVLAGIAFGLLTLKPQLGLLIPVALLAHGESRAVFAACLTAMALVAISCALFPPELWVAWLRSLPVYQSQYLRAGGGLDQNTVVTIAGNLVAAGAALGTAWILQGLAGLAVAVAVFLAFSRCTYRKAVAVLFSGMFVCTPHAYAYDTMPLVAAMLIWAPSSTAGVSLCVVAYLAPYLLLSPADRWFIYAIPETLLFIAIFYLAIRRPEPPDIIHEPVSSGIFARSI